MPIGRLGNTLSDLDKKEYFDQLAEKFNPATVQNIMCRHLISVSPGGKLYDCDFWQVLDIPVNNGGSDIHTFDYALLKNRQIITHRLCLLCTAGSGASCSGALT
jgi:hypothetical protein